MQVFVIYNRLIKMFCLIQDERDNGLLMWRMAWLSLLLGVLPCVSTFRVHRLDKYGAQRTTQHTHVMRIANTCAIKLRHYQSTIIILNSHCHWLVSILQSTSICFLAIHKFVWIFKEKCTHKNMWRLMYCPSPSICKEADWKRGHNQ